MITCRRELINLRLTEAASDHLIVWRSTAAIVRSVRRPARRKVIPLRRHAQQPGGGGPSPATPCVRLRRSGGGGGGGGARRRRSSQGAAQQPRRRTVRTGRQDRDAPNRPISHESFWRTRCDRTDSEGGHGGRGGGFSEPAVSQPTRLCCSSDTSQACLSRSQLRNTARPTTNKHITTARPISVTHQPVLPAPAHDTPASRPVSRSCPVSTLLSSSLGEAARDYTPSTAASQ